MIFFDKAVLKLLSRLFITLDYEQPV